MRVEPEVDVAEQRAALARQDHRARDEGIHAAAVVQEGGRREQVGVEPRVQLSGLAAERGDGHRVLGQAARVGVVPVLRRRCGAEALAIAGLAEHGLAERAQPVVVDLEHEEVDVAVEVVDVAPGAGHELGRVAGLDALHVAHLELDPAGVLAHPAEHADRVADVEALLEHRHAVPHARADASRAVGQLEIEKGASVAARATLLARHREGRIDERARRELAHERATGHSGEYRRASAGARTPPRSAAHTGYPGYPPRVSGQVPERVEIRPFHALHYAADRVHLADVVSPPYDVIDGDLRRRLLDRSPYNVVHLILPEPGEEREAGDTLEAWRRERVVVREPRPCMYWLEQHARGPDGVRRRRAGLIAALRLEPYAPGRVRRHERTMEGPKAGRLAVLRAVRANLSPIFMAYGDPSRRISETFEAVVADRRPLFETTDEEGTTHRLWRVCEDEPLRVASEVVGSRPLTIIDGHHRYETALAYRDERRAADGDPDELRAYDFAPVYLANRHDPGLMLFPTHRVVSGLSPELWERLPELLAERWELEEVADVDALERRIVAPARNVRSFGLVRGAGEPPLYARLRGAGADVARRRGGGDARALRPARFRRAAPSRRPIASPTCAARPTRPRWSTPLRRAPRWRCSSRRRRSPMSRPWPTPIRRCPPSRRSSSRRSSTAWSSTSSIRSTRDGRALAGGLSRHARRRRRGCGRGAARAPGRRARARRGR